MKNQAVALIAVNIRQMVRESDIKNAVKLYLNTLRATDKINNFLAEKELQILNNYLKQY